MTANKYQEHFWNNFSEKAKIILSEHEHFPIFQKILNGEKIVDQNEIQSIVKMFDRFDHDNLFNQMYKHSLENVIYIFANEDCEESNNDEEDYLPSVIANKMALFVERNDLNSLKMFYEKNKKNVNLNEESGLVFNEICERSNIEIGEWYSGLGEIKMYLSHITPITIVCETGNIEFFKWLLSFPEFEEGEILYSFDKLFALAYEEEKIEFCKYLCQIRNDWQWEETQSQENEDFIQNFIKEHSL